MADDSSPQSGSSAPALAFGTLVLGVLGIVALVVALVIGMDDGKQTSVATGTPETVDVTLTEFAVTPSSIDVADGTDLTLNVTNKGAVPHDLAVAGDTPKIALLAPGQSATLHVGT